MILKQIDNKYMVLLAFEGQELSPCGFIPFDTRLLMKFAQEFNEARGTPPIYTEYGQPKGMGDDRIGMVDMDNVCGQISQIFYDILPNGRGILKGLWEPAPNEKGIQAEEWIKKHNNFKLAMRVMLEYYHHNVSLVSKIITWDFCELQKGSITLKDLSEPFENKRRPIMKYYDRGEKYVSPNNERPDFALD